MIIHCTETKLVPISDLKPHPKNRNSHPKDQIERLAQILKYQGWRYPIKVSNRSGFVTSGHGRIEAAKLLGWNEVPVSYQDYVSDEQEYADIVADNAIASWSELDFSGINTDIRDLGPFDIDLLGIKNFTVEALDRLEPGCDEDDVPEHVDPMSKRGDIYQLGRHRLMCGDSTSIDDVEKLMADEKADMVFTDPPYGMNLDTDYTSMGPKSNKYQPVIGDDQPLDPGMLFGFFKDVPEMFLWGADYYAERLVDKNDGSWIVWDKRQTDREDIPQKYTLDKVWGSAFELCWSKSKHKREIFRVLWVAGLGEGKDEQRHHGGKAIRFHPTQKPIELCKRFIEQFSEPDAKIVDLFGGSGSTLIACEKTNRTCFMSEIDPHYIDIIIARWEKYTGKKAELISNG
jgi:DNA modification methylase